MVMPRSLLRVVLLANILLNACSHGRAEHFRVPPARRLLAPGDIPPTPLAVPPIDPLPAPLAPVILPPPDATVPSPEVPTAEPPVAAAPPTVPVASPPVVVSEPPAVVPPVVDPAPPAVPVPTAAPPVVAPVTPSPDPVPPVDTAPPAPVPVPAPTPDNTPPQGTLPPVSNPAPATPEQSPGNSPAPGDSPTPSPQGTPDTPTPAPAPAPADKNPAGAKPPPPPVPTLSPSGQRTDIGSVTGEDATQDSKSKGMSKAALAFTIIGALVGGLALVGIIIFCCVCVRSPTPTKSFISPEYTTHIEPVAPAPLQATSYMTYDAASSVDSRMPKDEYEFPPGHPNTGTMAVASQHMETLEEEQPPRFGNRLFSAMTGSRNHVWDQSFDSSSSSRDRERERAAAAVAHFRNLSQPLEEPPQYQRKYGAY